MAEAELRAALAVNGQNLRAINAIVWAWYAGHSDDVVFTVKVLIFSKTIRVRDPRGIFERLFGAQPTAEAIER